jgi:hypothetical protein
MNRKRIVLLTLIVCSFVVITALAGRRGQEQNQIPDQEQQRLDFENQFPIADYTASAPTIPDERATRQLRGRKFDKSPQAIDPDNEAEMITDMSHWGKGLSAIPVKQSSHVVVGKITEAKAYLSNDKTGVYSEFIFHIDSVLKNNNRLLNTDCSILVARIGGRVRFPSGRVSQYFTVGQGMPRVGQKYVLFLLGSEEEKYFYLLTGYELRGGKVFLLDNPGSGHPITAYQGKDELSLLKDIQVAIVNTLQAKPAR